MKSPTCLPAVYEYGRLSATQQMARITRLISTGRLGAVGGTQVPELQQMAAARIGRAHALAVSSATAGIELTLRALGVGTGNEVVVPALGWVSVGAAVHATGATLRVAPVTEDLTPPWDAIASQLTPATAAVVMAHLRGMPARGIANIATRLKQRDIPLIEDCAQAWGVRTGPRSSAGSHGAAAIFSLQTYKLIAAGEGGLVLCDDPQLMTMMRALSGDTTIATPAPLWRGNTRMSEITAALAIPQLRTLDDLIGQLRPLQHQTVHLLTNLTVAERVLPAAEGQRHSNGMHAGAWWPSAEAAHTLRTHLHAAGLRCWHPTTGDLHLHESWPIKAHATSPTMNRYLDVQIPALDPSQHPAFLDRLLQAIDKAGLLSERSPR